MTDVAYTETFDVEIVACLTEAMQLDMSKPKVVTFVNTYNNQVLERRFGETVAFSDNIELDDEYIFPNALEFCSVEDYMITCHDNQIDVLTSATPTDPSLSKTYQTKGASILSSDSQLCPSTISSKLNVDRHIDIIESDYLAATPT